jgi:phage portal protein BeeE
VTNEWDNTPWQGSAPPRTRTLSTAVVTQKAVTSLGPWATGIPLSSVNHSPQDRMAAYLRAYKVGWFYKAGRKIADDFANLPWRVKDGDSESTDPEETTLQNPDLDIPFDQLSPIQQFQRLMERPNPSQTGRQLRKKTRIRLDFAGCAFWYLEGVDAPSGLPTAIYGISPPRMWPAYDRQGQLIGWVMDKDQPSGGVPFDANEILLFCEDGADDDPFGVSVVQSVQGHVGLSDAMATHVGDVMATGGRLAGMLWPKSRALDEAEFTQAQRAWRNATSDTNAARRLLLFPEPMEYSAGAASPKDIGLPELAAVDRDAILTAFPISPYQLGVPMPGGLNSAETRRVDRGDYWQNAIHPRVAAYDETIQVQLLERYERVMGQTFSYETEEPNLDDAPALLERVAALRALAAAGFDEKAAVRAAGLDHIKFGGIPAPAPVAEGQEPEENTRSVVRDNTPRDNTSTQQTLIGKAIKAREDVASRSTAPITRFLAEQRERVTKRIRATMPRAKAQRMAWTKADPDWWDAALEDGELAAALRVVYEDAGREGLQVVATSLDRIVPNKAVDRIVADLVTYGGERIPDINARTLQAITMELAEGTRRGYSVTQLIDGVPDEGFKGVLNVGLDNGIGAWDELRAETIARTETALSYNRAALEGYRDFRVREVVAIDGDTDAECANRNGATFSLDDALSVTDHPNGTLDWVPVVP